MQKILWSLALLLFLSACQDATNQKTAATATPENTTPVKLKSYPANLQKVLDQHGGLAQWQKMRAMSYEIVKEGGNEAQMIDLHNRRERIEASNFTTGYDGKDFWLEADTTYKGNAIFYHNLMFYFYAMPFVLADDGIIYNDVAPLKFEDKEYPGIRISYNDGVGVSPKDEYFIYYDAATQEMAWLAYTVTYFSKEKSKKLGWIRYDDWKVINGVKLPNSLSWYNSEEGKPTDFRNKVAFDNIKVAEEAFADKTFAKTEKAEILSME